MGGISLKNFRESSVIARNLRHGADFWLPPSDPEFICLFQGIESGTADGNFTLNPEFVQHGQCLPWPQRIYVVVQNNRLSTLGAPGVLQANPNLSGSRWLDVVITGKLNGKVRTEPLRVDVTTLVSIGTQLAAVESKQLYDEITSIRHQAKVGTWGASRNLFIGVGTGCSLRGQEPQARMNVLSPIRPSNLNRLKNLYVPEGGASYGYGTGRDTYSINANDELDVPVRGRLFDQSLGACVVTTSTSARSVARVNHGLRQGDPIQVRPLDNGLPGGLRQPNTSATRIFTAQASADTLTLASHGIANHTRVRVSRAYVGGVLQPLPAPLVGGDMYYFVVGTAANTLQLATTYGGAAINITADSTGVGITIVDTFFAMPLSADAFMISPTGCPFNAAFLTAGDTFGLTAHGLANGTPVLMMRVLVGASLAALPTGFTELTVPYFVVNAAADTFQLEATVGGGAITPASADTTVGIIPCATLAAAGNFANGETIEVLRPRMTWERARLVYTDGNNIERGA